jgi:hypothetical protein
MIKNFIDEISIKENLYMLLKDEYGNFVVQKALRLGNEYNSVYILNLVFGCFYLIKNNKHLLM